MSVCKLCLKEDKHCTCINAHKKHAEHVNKANVPVASPVGAPVEAPVAAPVKEYHPEDVISGPNSADIHHESEEKPKKKKKKMF